MTKTKIKSNGSSESQLQSRTLPEELSSLLLMTAEHEYRNGGKFNIDEKLQYLNHYIKLLGKYIQDKDTKNALIVQCLYDHAFYNLGLGKPLYLEWAARRGGRAEKIKKGIWTAIEKYLAQREKATPLNAWKHFKITHSNDNAFETSDLNYEVWFYKDPIDDTPTGGYLYQKSFDGKESSIKFKTFEKYFYRIRSKVDSLQA